MKIYDPKIWYTWSFIPEKWGHVLTKTHVRNVPSSFICNTPELKIPWYFSLIQQLTEPWYLHSSVKYYTAISRSGLLAHTATWVGLQRGMLRAESQAQKVTWSAMCLFDILEMTALQMESRLRQEKERDECGPPRSAQEILGMECFNPDSVSDVVLWLCECEMWPLRKAGARVWDLSL